jgi:thiosulfate sulfurtransferase
MKASHAVVFYTIFLVVTLVVTAGVMFKRTTPDASPLWLTPQEANNLLKTTPDVVVIDLSRHFYRSGHLPSAVNYTKCETSSLTQQLDKNSNVLVYCHGAGAPIGAANAFKEAGFKNVFALQGNYGAWLKAGYPIEN